MDLSISQNFLKNVVLVQNLVTKAGIKEQDVVLDIGAGKGIITEELAKHCKKVIAIEFDQKLAELLTLNFANHANVEIIQSDFLKIKMPDEPYKVFSNIPFNISSPIFNKLYFVGKPPEESYLILQSETANRFMGMNEGALLSLLLQPLFDMRITYQFGRTDFEPAPGVDVVLLNIKKRDKFLIDAKHLMDYRDFVSYVVLQQKQTFKKRVKTLFLPAEMYDLCNKLNIDPTDTIYKLNFEQWLGLFDYFIQNKGDRGRVIKGAFSRYLITRDLQDKYNRTRTY